MTEQLKPCPFCGNTDLSVKYIDYKCYAVECNNCGAIGRFKETKDDAISAWNSRLNESTKHINEIQVQSIERFIQIINKCAQESADSLAKLNDAVKQLRAKHD